MTAAFTAQPDEHGGGDREEDESNSTKDACDGNVSLCNVPGGNAWGGCTGHCRMVVGEQ